MIENSPAKSVVVTGASTGIGRACVLHLDERGVRVFAGVRKESDGASLKRYASDNLTPVLIDVTDPGTIASAYEVIAQAVGPQGLAGLVNNAGIFFGGPLEFSSIKEMRKEFEVNFFGVIAMTQAFLPLLRAGRGRIVNMSSGSGFVALPFLGPYAASKHALEAISDSWRVELWPWRIWVALVEPGLVDTPLREKTISTLKKAREEFPPEAHKLYGNIFGTAERQQARGVPPKRVAEVVEHALFSSRPKRRYLVGLDAVIFSIFRRIPVSIRDWFMATHIGRSHAPRQG